LLFELRYCVKSKHWLWTWQTDKARAELAKAEGKFDQYRKDAADTTMKKIDAADRKVEEGAAKAKGGISSWFGGK
jgi:hypothetical protein